MQIERDLDPKRDNIEVKTIKQKLMTDEFLEFIETNTKPLARLYSFYRCAIMEVETKFKVLNEEFSLEYDRNPIEGIKSRIKSESSLLRKVRNKGLELDVNAIEKNIADVAGVRVICSFPEDIYKLAEYFLQQDDITLIERKDYIQNPKPSGYRSLHLIVEVPIFLHNEKRPMKVEVQLRTIAMDFWASVEHKLRYKKNLPVDLQKELYDELNKCAEESSNLDLRMQAIKNRIAEVTQMF